RDTITVRIEAATFASLSPDGEWLLVDRAQEDESAEGTQLCLIEVADMGDECILMPDLASVQGPFVAWSSDSRYVVLNEDPTAVSTTNVWLFDLDTGDDLNLSALFPPAETPEQHYDRAPAISPSLEMVAFVRHTDDESWIHLVNLATEAHSTMPMTAGIIGNLRWLPDGSGLFYTLFNSASPADNGLWQVTLNDRAAVQLYEVPELYGPPFLSAVAETGNSVLLVYPMHEERADAPKAGYYYELISLPVAQGADLLSTGFWRSAAALAPDGATLMTVEEGRDAHRVTVQSVITGELTEAIELVSLDLDLTATSESFGLGATWYAPERIFLAGRFDAEMNGRLLIVE
ncbi:MAG: hypothetical protein R2867_33180, partial [Caldilineaceae bacterium]